MNNTIIFKNCINPAKRDFASRNNVQTRQDKNFAETKEGVLVNSFFKENDNCSPIILTQNQNLPEDLFAKKEKISKFPFKSPLMPLVLAPLFILGGLALFSAITRKILVNNMDKMVEKIPDMGRNININKETIFNIHNFFQNPAPKTFLIGACVITATAIGFIMKNFVDGLKEIWVKKKEADIKRNLDEALISIETRSFSGKNQILRSMLSQKAQEMKQTIDTISFNGYNKMLFSKFAVNPAFEKKEGNKSKLSDKNWFYALLGAGTLLAAGIFTGIIFKNYRAIAQKMEISKKVIEKSRIFKELPPECGGNVGKIGFNSFVNDITAFIYVFLSNPTAQTGGLLTGIYAASALGYLGEKTVEAIKEVKVKEANAETERQLQDRLVQVELKNFLTKKQSFVEPLIEEFNKQAGKNKNRQDLQRLSENLLCEIRNGPPFIYS